MLILIKCLKTYFTEQLNCTLPACLYRNYVLCVITYLLHIHAVWVKNYTQHVITTGYFIVSKHSIIIEYLSNRLYNSTLIYYMVL